MKSLFSFFVRNLIMKIAVDKIRERAVLLYLKILQATRRSLIAVVAIFFILQTMVLGFVGSVVTAVWIWAPDFESKLIILLVIFGSFFLLPLFALFYVFSETLWIKASGAARIISSQNENS